MAFFSTIDSTLSLFGPVGREAMSPSEAILYRKSYRFGQKNNIFRYGLISVYRFEITAVYL